MKIQAAEKSDAESLAYLINLAGEGIPYYLWTSMAEEGQDPMAVGSLRAAREEGGFSYTNARTYVNDNKLNGMIISYKQPDPYSLEGIEDYPDVVRPLVELESELPGSWYVNAIATFQDYQGKGVAQALLGEAEDSAIEAGCTQMSLIVASENVRAKRLYDYLGYASISSLPVVNYPGCLHGGNWLLMKKDIT